MSANTEQAKRLLSTSTTPAGRQRPADYDLRLAEAFAAIATAEALERIAERLELAERL